MKKTILPILASLVAICSYGQVSDLKKVPSIGGSFFVKDIPDAAKLFSHNADDWTTPFTTGLSGQYIQGITPKIDFVGSLGATFSQYKQPNGSFYYSENTYKKQQKLLLDFDGLFNFKFGTDDKKIVPYITAGLGFSAYNNSYLFPYGTAGGGLQVSLGNDIFLYGQSLFKVGITSASKENLNFSVGVSFPLKKKLTAVKPVVVVDVDTDKDGVTDSKDKCPTIAGLAKYDGCPIPDTDNDGINDEADSCKTIPGLAKYHGCPIPDTDKDGINDEEDKCPTEPGIARYHGCPIPDTDKDGVNDEEDKCPTEPGIAANKGCPEIQSKMNELAKSVYFTPGGSTISPKAYPALEQITNLMKKYTGFNLEIEGHTDNLGSPIANQKISQKRADALKNYFISKGIDAGRLYAIGYGLEKPIASNKTAAGRALNRRVEMHAKY